MSLIRRAAWALLGEPIPGPEGVPPNGVPAGVRFRRGGIVPVLGGVLAWSPRPALAVTLRRTIILEAGAQLTPELLAHELTHVRQWREDILFPLRYSVATLRHGYYHNPYEVEAREAARSAGGATDDR